MQAIDDNDWNGSAREIRECIQPEADVARQICDARTETLRPSCLLEFKLPDGPHRTALNDEEDDLGGVAETSEDEEGPQENFEGEGTDMADDPEDGEAYRNFDETDAEDVEDLTED